MLAASRERFRFGLEAEYLLVDSESFQPLSYRNLSFSELNDTLESIPVADLRPVDGLVLQPPHRKIMPYLVEGYHLPDPAAPDATLLPKGIEIRTPVCPTISETVESLQVLHERLQRALAEMGFCCVALSHHPLDDTFEGPQGGRRFDLWQWAQQAMLTYGPDMNISLPAGLARRLDTQDLFAKVNYYAPAMTALTLAAPFHRGRLWSIRGRIGKSLRTHRRSVAGQPLELHPEQDGRLEFKSFEMTHRLGDFQADLLLWLAVLLDNGLRGRASQQSRVYDLGAIARHGLEADTIFERASELLDRARHTLAAWDFDPEPLRPFHERLVTGRVPADDLIEQFQAGATLPEVLRPLASLVGDAACPASADELRADATPVLTDADSASAA